MATKLSLVELAKQVQEQVQALSSRLDSLKAPQPSFALDGPPAYPEDPQVGGVRMQLLDSLFHLQQLVMGPEDYLKMNTLAAKHDDLALYAFSKLKIFDNVPLDGSEISYADLAAKTGAPESYIYRFIRLGRANNLFTEPRPGYVAHTAFSIAAAREPRSQDWIDHNYEDVAYGAVHQIEAIEKYGESQETGISGLGLAFNMKPDQTMFQLWDSIEGGRRATRFGRALGWALESGAYAAAHVVNGFDWKGLGEATVIDVGGSSGGIAFQLAKHNPSLKVIVQDLPGLEQQFHDNRPADLKDRVSFQAHDFFTPQTVHASVYYMRFILHDWPDVHAAKIISGLVPAMKDGDRIILNENVLIPHGILPQPVERLQYALDLQMMVALNAKERTREDWVSLLALADKRLELKNIAQPPGSALSLIEAVFHA